MAPLKKLMYLLAIALLATPVWANKTTKLQNALIDAMGQYQISDLSVSVIKSQNTLYLADLHRDNDAVLTTSSGVTRFRLASLTKLFTAQAIMQLVEKGCLSLDDKVSLYIPEFTHSQINIQHLLTHYSGLQDKVRPEPFSPASNIEPYLTKVLAGNPNIKIGMEFGYSDTGFNLLGHIITLVSGSSYPEYIEQHILQPAEMKNSGFYSGPNGLQASVPPFKNAKQLAQNERRPFDPHFFPAEGLISNVEDLTLWLKMVLTKDPKLLSQSSYQLMFTPHNNTTWHATQIGLSWFMHNRHGREYVFHMGGVRGYATIIAIEPKTEQAIIILSNNSETPRWEIVDLIADLIENNDTQPINKK